MTQFTNPMPKFLFSLLILALLTACGAGPATPSAQRNTPQPAATVRATTPAIGACTKLRGEDIPGTPEPSLFPPVGAQEHIAGEAAAIVTIVEYSDFQCAGCDRMAYVLAYILNKYPQQVRLVYRPFPLVKVNDKAALSAQAAEAAGLQGKFWEMHDRLFQNQATWNPMKPEEFKNWLAEQAAAIDLDKTRFLADLESPETVQTVEQARLDGEKIGLQGAPLLLINREIQKPPYILVELENIVRLKMLATRQFTDCPPPVIDPARQYTATLQTAKGTIVIRLLADKAPNTVNNFVFLARQGWYDNITFQRVLPGLWALTGDPSGTGLGNPGYFIPDEIDRSLRFDRPGMVAMYNSGPDANGGLFFITYAALSRLNGNYSIFGQVTSGLDALSQLTPRDPQPGVILPEGDALLRVTIEER
jgi:cyclophilin family peptidyl-prolyl cis-trans isomerase/protein-disulfide isomerase